MRYEQERPQNKNLPIPETDAAEISDYYVPPEMCFEIPPCDSPVHAPGCNGEGSTVDHFTPECIGKLWGWTSEQINSRENTQNLSFACHVEKDRTTQARLALAMMQMGGKRINFGDHQKIESPDYHLPRFVGKKKETREETLKRKMKSDKHYKNNNGINR